MNLQVLLYDAAGCGQRAGDRQATEAILGRVLKPWQHRFFETMESLTRSGAFATVPPIRDGRYIPWPKP